MDEMGGDVRWRWLFCGVVFCGSGSALLDDVCVGKGRREGREGGK